MRNSAGLFLGLFLLPTVALAKDYPGYRQLAQAPSAYAQQSYLRFTMRFLGLKDVDQAFKPAGRNPTTHVELVTPAMSGKRLPVFLSKRKSYQLRKLRNSPTGKTFLFRGRIRYFKTPVYDMQSLMNAKAPGIKIQANQSRGFRQYYNYKVETTQGTKPKPSRYDVNYVLDIFEIKESKTQTAQSSSSGGTKRPGPGPGPGGMPKMPGQSSSSSSSLKNAYRMIGIKQLAAGSGKKLSGIPIRFTMPYMGQMGALLSSPLGKQIAGNFSKPKISCVGENNLGSSSQMQVLKPPGPLGKIVAISFGKDWDVAKRLRKLQNGQMVEVSGVLYQGGMGGSIFLFVLEGVKAVSGGAPRKPSGATRKPGFGPGGG